MKEKTIKIRGKKYKELYSQILYLVLLILILIEEIRNHVVLWAIVPVAMAIIVIFVLLQLTYLWIREENKKIGKPILRCYHWEEYLVGSKNKKIYADPLIYVEIECDDYTYAKFISVYNTNEKIKNLVYRKFRGFIPE